MPNAKPARAETVGVPIKGPASYFPSIETKYGRSIAEWQQIVRDSLPAKQGQLVSILKEDHGMGHGHANAVVAYVLAAEKPAPTGKIGAEKLTPAESAAASSRRHASPAPVKIKPSSTVRTKASGNREGQT